MYELLKLIDFAGRAVNEGKQLALATIIHTIGSSYRKTGTQMMIAHDLSYAGALSGGCVEKEVIRQAQLVFSHGKNVVFEYDGRYKLGCNGRIFILIESLEHTVVRELSNELAVHHKFRKPFSLLIQKSGLDKAATSFSFASKAISISSPLQESEAILENIPIPPQHQLVILGGEYDSMKLADMADQTGMKTWLVLKESFPHKLSEGVQVLYANPEALADKIRFDERTAIVIMTHSLSKDLNFLMEMIKVPSAYLGILGPVARRETILNDLMNYNEGLFLQYQDKLEGLKGPVGLNIGARTPEEISVSILGEVIGVFNAEKVVMV